MKNRVANRKNKVLAAVVALGLIGVGGQAVGDTTEGRTLAMEWCSSCHLVEPGQAAATSDVAPSFPEMANNPAYTEERLRSWLWAPHPPMPDFDLSRYEIESLVSYIMSLSTE